MQKLIKHLKAYGSISGKEIKEESYWFPVHEISEHKEPNKPFKVETCQETIGTDNV